MSEEKGPRPRDLQKSATRDKLLLAAKVLFEAHGFESATMREIAKAAGVSTGAAFNIWPGKAAIYRDVFGHDPITPEQGRKLAEALKVYGVEPALLLAA